MGDKQQRSQVRTETVWTLKGKGKLRNVSFVKSKVMDIEIK